MRRRRYDASCTVEASYVMAMVIFLLAMLIKVSYGKCEEVTGSLRMHHAVYQLRGQEGGDRIEFTAGQWEGSVGREQNRLVGGAGNGKVERKIEMPIHNPEEIMRKMTIVEDVKEQIQQGASMDGEKTDG